MQKSCRSWIIAFVTLNIVISTGIKGLFDKNPWNHGYTWQTDYGNMWKY